MQLELHALHPDGHWGAQRLLLLGGLPRIGKGATTELETLMGNGRSPHAAFEAQGGPARLKPKIGPGPNC